MTRKQKQNLKSVLWIIGICWIIFLINNLLGLGLNRFGILPRTQSGIIGIACSPFLHGSFRHIMANTAPLLVLLSLISFFYPRIFWRVNILIILLGGFCVWLFARPAIHIGASGWIYGLAAFMIAIGFYNKSLVSILIGILVIIVYGGMFWGLFPTHPQISMEGHLFGAIAGVGVAWLNRKERPTQKL